MANCHLALVRRLVEHVVELKLLLPAVLYILGLLPFGIYLLGASQEHVCGASESMVARVTGSNFAQAYIPASGQEAVEKKIGYPWNVTERAQGHATTSYDAYTYSPNVISTVKGISGVVCGENGVAYLRAAGGLVRGRGADGGAGGHDPDGADAALQQT